MEAFVVWLFLIIVITNLFPSHDPGGAYLVPHLQQMAFLRSKKLFPHSAQSIGSPLNSSCLGGKFVITMIKNNQTTSGS